MIWSGFQLFTRLATSASAVLLLPKSPMVANLTLVAVWAAVGWVISGPVISGDCRQPCMPSTINAPPADRAATPIACLQAARMRSATGPLARRGMELGFMDTPWLGKSLVCYGSL